MTELRTPSAITLDRRSFIALSAAATSALCAASLAGCENDLAEAPAENGTASQDETWLPVVCWAHCGGKCGLKALVKDGAVIRLKTDDTHEDDQDYPQHRACLRGRARRMDVFSADRIKYPMKRKHWQPGGGENSHGDMRGVDEWERIGWDEALDYVADEIARIKEAYGNRSILGSGFNPTDASLLEAKELPDFAEYFIKGLDFGNVLNAFGGQVYHYGTASAGSYQCVPQMFGYGTGSNSGGKDFMNDRMDARTCEYAIMLGVNPAWSADGTTFWANYLPMKESGCTFISIDPFYTDSAEVLGAEWIPIRPGTDTAFLLACAYVMIMEDDPETNPLIDWDVVDRCTIGFDAGRMPKGSDPQQNFKDHVLGTYSGVPASPEWAADICGIAPEDIERIARILGKDNKVALLSSWAPARGNNADSLPQIFMALAALGGHFGKSGHMTGCSIRDTGVNGGDFLITPGMRKLPYIPNPVDDCIYDPIIWPAVLNKHYTYNGMAQFLQAEERDLDIHCIYNYSLNMMHRHEGLMQAIEAYRSVDFVVTQAINFNVNAQYSDIVLPLATPWESPMQFAMFTGRESAFIGNQVCEPLWETKRASWIGRELLTRWGLDPDTVYPYSDEQQSFFQMSSAMVATEDGSGYEPLISFTQQDIDELGVEGQPQEGRIAFSEMRMQGVFAVPRKEGDPYGHIAYREFHDDPEGHPMNSESGKMELYCRRVNEVSRRMGFSEVPPLPTYTPPIGGYEDTFSDVASKTKGAYPFQVYNPHYPRTSHSHFDDVAQLREAWKRPLYINARDAAALGIEEGDTVQASNDYGTVVRQACVTNRICEGVVALPHGGWVEIDPETGFDLGGSGNTLCAPIATGCGTSGYNTQVCSIAKVDAKPVDWERPLVMPACQAEDQED